MKFNVIVENNGKFVPYDIIPYLKHVYFKRIRRKNFPVPITIDEWKEFIKEESQYKWWGRCEYEIILTSWPPKKDENGIKIDVHEQVIMNLDLIAELMFNYINNESNENRKQKISN